MNTPVKIAIGLAATAAGTLALAVLRKRKETQQQYAAPDGTLHRKGESYRSAHQKKDQNGREIRNEKPEGHFVTDRHASPSSQANDSVPHQYNGAAKNVQYHHRGVRNR